MSGPLAPHALVPLAEAPLSDDPLHSAGDGPFALARARRWLVWVVFLGPVAIALVYNFIVATPRYSSDIAFVVRSSSSSRDRLSIVSLGQGGGIGTSDDSEAVVAYLKSRDVVDVVNHDGLLTRSFSRAGLDPVSAFPSVFSGSTREDFYRHVHDYVHTDFDRATNIIHVQVQSFSANEAREVARRLLGASEAMVNRLNQRARSNTVDGAMREVAQASDALMQVTAKIGAVRNRNHIIDPQLDSAASVKLQSGTTAQLAQIDVQLAETLRSAPQTPLLGHLRARRSALEAELVQQVGASTGVKASLADRLRDYEILSARREIAEKQLMGASLELIGARSAASRQTLFLEQIARPNLPDEALYPRRWLNLLLTLVVAGCLLWICWSLAEVLFDDE